MWQRAPICVFRAFGTSGAHSYSRSVSSSRSGDVSAGDIFCPARGVEDVLADLGHDSQLGSRDLPIAESAAVEIILSLTK